MTQRSTALQRAGAGPGGGAGAILEHPCLASPEAWRRRVAGTAGGPGDAPLDAGPSSDRQRLGLLLQGVALVAHLDRAGLRLPAGWSAARLADDGRLRAGPAEAGADPRLPQERALDLLHHLFNHRLPVHRRRRRVAGPGPARRAARALQRRWDGGLLPLPADQLLGQLLEESPSLWGDLHADDRRALAGVHRRGEGEELWVAGPGPLRWRLLRAAAGDRRRLADLLAATGVERYLHAAPVGGTAASGSSPADLAAAGRWRAAVAAWREHPPSGASERRRHAVAWLALGRARRALEVLRLSPRSAPEDLALAAVCQLHLGRLRAARRTVSRARERGGGEAPSVRLALAEVAVRALANAGDGEAAREEALAALEAFHSSGPLHRGRAHLLAALASWDVGDREATSRHLDEAASRLDGAAVAEAPEGPVLVAGLRQTRALAALADGDPATAREELSRALADHRRRLPRYLAAALWNDLALARARGGDLAGAEKGFARSLTLYRGCDGSRRTTVGLANLAEVRLRRGRLAGVETILERATATNRAAGNRRLAVHDRLLWGRHELAQGRARAALQVLREAEEAALRHGLEDEAAEARLLAARSLGWLGRSTEAAEVLDRVSPPILGRLEPEERPALLAHAGRRDEALGAATRMAGENAATLALGALARLWEAALTNRAAPPGAWQPLLPVGGYRAARALFDLEILRPGWVPSRHRRQAIAALRGQGASRLAERLEVRDEGPWRALVQHLSRLGAGAGEVGAAPGAEVADVVAAWEALLADFGHPGARIWWESDDDARVLVDRPGGDAELTLPCDGGRLVLRAPAVDPPLEALLHLLAREVPDVLRSLASAGREGRDGRRRSTPGDGRDDGGIVGESPALRRAVERAGRLATGEMPILVLGESGTGKELLALHVHRTSPRRHRPLVPVNCAALSETLVLSDLFGHVRGAFTGADRDRAGVFETAEGGTVFLDEIGDLPAPAQGMLLRVLQEGEVRRVGESVARRVDVRVVAATHVDLAAAVEEGSFRRDLFYRLKGATVELPPLRERGRDVLLLADHLLASAAGGEDGGAPAALSEEARGRLRAHTWPGNVRELQNVLAVGATLATHDGGVIEAHHLELPAGRQGAGAAAGDYHQQVKAYRRRLVEEALRAEDGNQAAAARRLGLTRQALSYLVKSLEVKQRP